MRKLHDFFLSQSRRTIILMLVCMVILFGWLDYITGFEIAFSFFYLIPGAIATWYISRNSGYILIVGSMVLWLIINRLVGETYSSEIIRYWNTLIRLVVFVFMIRLVDEFKHALYHQRLLAHTDYLTGIANNREFFFQAETELQRARRFEHPISLAYIDVDDFKRINDQFGHSEGDRVLQFIANEIQAVIRQTDTVARIGGDEFVVLLPDTDESGAGAIIQKITDTLRQGTQSLASLPTLSIGVVTYHKTPERAYDLLNRADEAMYDIKSHSKDGVNFLSK